MSVTRHIPPRTAATFVLLLLIGLACIIFHRRELARVQV